MQARLKPRPFTYDMVACSDAHTQWHLRLDTRAPGAFKHCKCTHTQAGSLNMQLQRRNTMTVCAGQSLQPSFDTPSAGQSWPGGGCDRNACTAASGWAAAATLLSVVSAAAVPFLARLASTDKQSSGRACATMSLSAIRATAVLLPNSLVNCTIHKSRFETLGSRSPRFSSGCIECQCWITCEMDSPNLLCRCKGHAKVCVSKQRTSAL